MGQRGRPKKYGETEREVLRQIVSENPVATLEEVGRALEQRTGVGLSADSIKRALREAGVERRRTRPQPEPAADAHESGSASRRYGYQSEHRPASAGQGYPSSFTDAEWALVEDLFVDEHGSGKPPRYSRRMMVDACCYVVRTGCPWRLLPAEFPPWQNVYRTFRRWSAQGRFEAMHDRLRAQWREREQRNAAPSAGALDAQSTRHSPQGGPSGFDPAKKIKGRKRHLLTDMSGLVLAVSVTAASVADRDGAHPVMASATAKYPSLETVFVDSAYAGRCAQTVQQQHGVQLDVVRHPCNAKTGHWAFVDQPDLFTESPATAGWQVVPKRWVVERTHAWIERARRLIMHHDRRTDVSETWVWLAAARQLLRRLTS